MIRIFILSSTLLALISCANRKTGSATVSSGTETAATTAGQTIYGTYTGTLPAADGPGIAVTLTLFDDGYYTSSSEYLERNTTYNEEGRFTIEKDRLTLYPDEGEPADSYRIENNRLRMLDSERKPVTGKLAEYYVLTRK